MFYTIYKIVNKINEHFYIGAHQTEDLNDDYYGSGELIKKAIGKYGKENFEKVILFTFDTAEEMYAKEAELVDKEFVKRSDTYNIRTGGIGGFVDPVEIGRKGAKILHEKCKNDSELKNRVIGPMLASAKPFTPEVIKMGQEAAKSSESRDKRKATMKRKGHSKGEKNSQYGTKWITNGVKNKKLKSEENMPDGFYFGRINVPVV